MSKKNFTISTVATAPSPATSGTSLVVASGDGSLFAVNEPAIIFPVNNQPLVANAEIVMVTDVTTDTLTITRTQESTSARTIVEGDIIIQGITAKDWNDLVTLVAGKITAFADPNADRIVFWDDSAGAFVALTASTGLTISDTNMTVRSASATQTGIVELATTAETETGTDATRAVTPDGLHDMTTLAGAGWLKDEDDMVSNSATTVPSQQSVKAYVDSKGFTWKGAWATSISYSVNDTVESNGSGYVCTSAHTSGSATEPGVGASWTTNWDLFVEGVGGNSIQVDSSGGTSDTYGTLSGLVNSSNTVYTVSLGSYISGSLRVYLNGQLQTQGSSEDWTETTPASGTFTFATAPTTGDIIIVMYQFSSGATGNADTLDGVHLAGLLDLFYPIGTIYETTSSDLDTTTKMNAHFGGTWEAYGSGRVLVAKSSDTEFDTIGETGGAKTHTLSIDEMPSHTHSYGSVTAPSGGGFNGHNKAYDLYDSSIWTWMNIGNTGGGGAHNNLQPYIVVYRYRRTA